jgi:UMF1 family MFS transporter
MAGGAPPTVATRSERLAWSMYDFANSGYTTVVLTTVFNAYFVAVVAGGAEISSGVATFLWTATVATGNAIVLFSGPVIGAIADHRAWKKRFLLITTIGCVLTTGLLGFVGEGDVVTGAILLILSLAMFASGENLIAAFLPEIAPDKHMGRLSGYGWALGYAGGLVTLGCCLAYITWAGNQGQDPTQFIPVTLWITAVIFAVAALPTFLVLRERATPKAMLQGKSYLAEGLVQVRTTLRDARRFKDLFRFLITLVVYQAGVSTVVVVAAIYAQEVFEFSSDELIFLIMIVNVTAAVGALAIGHLQDKAGSSRALSLALSIWIIAVILVLVAESRGDIWFAANLIGLAMGSSQSAGRALMGHFTPAGRAGEFFGLWGLASRCAAIIGPATYGAISMLSGGNQRIALLSTLGFFILGLLLLATVNEARGRRATMPLGMN